MKIKHYIYSSLCSFDPILRSRSEPMPTFLNIVIAYLCFIERLTKLFWVLVFISLLTSLLFLAYHTQNNLGRYQTMIWTKYINGLLNFFFWNYVHIYDGLWSQFGFKGGLMGSSLQLEIVVPVSNLSWFPYINLHPKIFWKVSVTPDRV